MLLLAPKLSEKTINNQLLKYFAKLQMDQEVWTVCQSCKHVCLVSYYENVVNDISILYVCKFMYTYLGHLWQWVFVGNL